MVFGQKGEVAVYTDFGEHGKAMGKVKFAPKAAEWTLFTGSF